jgi:hypothetical protein
MNDFLIQMSINSILGLLHVYTSNPKSSTAGKFLKGLITLRDALNVAFPAETTATTATEK